MRPCSVCTGSTAELQPSGFRFGLPGAHLPAPGEDWSPARAEPAAAEAALLSAEGLQDGKDKRGL